MLTPLFAHEEKPFSVYEIGCALGHLGDYLREHFPVAQFSGSDINERFVNVCQTRFPDGIFHFRNIVEELPPDRYDYVVAIGIYNHAGDSNRDEWQKLIYQMLNAMYSIATRGIGITFLTTYYDPDCTRQQLHYQDEKAVMDHTVKNLSRHFELDHRGPLYEYALRVYRPSHIQSLYPQETFRKYFKGH
jgi:cyclopropane fatty-acyl-phospholipid synthase-like methyltransferase